MKGHCRILKGASGRIPLLGAKMDLISAKYNFTRPYRFELEGCEERELKPDINIFTDGSKSSRGTGSGIFSEELNLRQSISLGHHPTVFQAELIGLTLGTKAALDNNIYGKRIRFTTDSKALLQALRGPKINSALVLECHQMLKRLAESNPVELVWVKGHTGNQGNEEADRLARKGSDRLFVGPELSLPLTSAALTSLIKKDTLRRHSLRWGADKDELQSEPLV